VNYLKKLLNLNNADGTRESMRESYAKHFSAAQKGEIPLPDDINPHLAGLYGALSTRYIAAKISRPETVLWAELVPFLLMSEKESMEALAEYVVCVEDSKDRQREEWLRELINTALRKITTADENYKCMAISAITQTDIYWLSLLDSDIRELLRKQGK